MTVHVTGLGLRKFCGALVGAALLLTACSPTEPAPPGSSSRVESSVREAIIRGLPSGGFAADLARNAATTYAELPVDWLKDGKVYDLQNLAGHPQRLYVALASDGQVSVLSGQPDAFIALSKTVPVSGEAAAVVRASQFLELSRSMDTLSYEVSSVDAIRWSPKPTEAESAKIAALRGELGSLIGAASAQAKDGGWVVTLWRVNQDSLERHVVFVAASGELTDRAEVVRTKLPVVIGR